MSRVQWARLQSADGDMSQVCACEGEGYLSRKCVLYCIELTSPSVVLLRLLSCLSCQFLFYNFFSYAFVYPIACLRTIARLYLLLLLLY